MWVMRREWSYLFLGMAALSCAAHSKGLNEHSQPLKNHINESGKIQSYIYVTEVTEDVIQQLKKMGVEIDLANKPLKMIQGWVPSDQIQKISALPFIVKITPPTYGVTKIR